MNPNTANFCLLPSAVQAFKEALKDGRLNPEELAGMTSIERHELFAGIVGEGNATGVNSLFESKILLKNQQQGYISWAKKVSGITPEVRRDLITRIQRLDRVLNPAEEEQFLQDLAATRLGLNVTEAEAQQIADLSKKVTETKAAMETGGDRLEYGRARVALTNYVNELKNSANKEGVGDYALHPGKVVSKTAGLAKSVKASLDNSAIFRQGWKTLITNPGIWQHNARQSFIDLVRQLGNKPVMDEVNADIVSRPTYDQMLKAKLAIGNLEEEFPTTLPEKVPVLGRAYKASESAYTGFIRRQRADIFDKYLDIAEKSGVNIADKQELQAIGKLVNSLTGRGSLGKLEGGGDFVNNIFFSPRFIKSNFDVLTAHTFDKTSGFARKNAAINLLKVVSATAAILAVARAVNKKSVEFDPRSADFGKIKIGNTRFDVTGGASALVTLASRLVTLSSKSTTSGEVKKLNSGYGSQTGVDVVNNFFDNKLSPAASIVKDLLNQKDFNGNKPTVVGELNNAFTPLPITTYQELKNDPNAANALMGLIADGLGISANTYGKSTQDWTQNPTKELLQFKQKVGAAEFVKANELYNKRVDDWVKDNKEYVNALPNDQRSAGITNHTKAIKKDIFKSYNFKYKLPPRPKKAAIK